MGTKVVKIRKQHKSRKASSSPMKFGFPSTAFSSSSPVSGDTVPGVSATAPSSLFGANYSSTTASTDTSTMPWFLNAITPVSVSSATSSSSVSEITTTTVTANTTSCLSEKASISTALQPQSTVSAPEFVTVPACCSLEQDEVADPACFSLEQDEVVVPASCSFEQDEVAAILARKCEKLLSSRAARQAQGRGQNEIHNSAAQPWARVATGFETISSNNPVVDSIHIPAATAEQKYGESKLCSAPMTGAPSTSTPSIMLDSKLGCSLLSNSQLAEKEPPNFPPVDLLHLTIEMWKRVVGNKKTDQEVLEEGLRHFYEGINYFCLMSERLQIATNTYNEAANGRDDMEKVNSSLKEKLAEARQKVKDFKNEKESLEHELARAADKITTLTAEKECILRIQTTLHQTVSELRSELELVGPVAIQKYKASSLYRQELMEYAAAYMGKGVKLAIEKIKAKDPTFDPKTYGLEMYILPPEADDQEFSSEEERDGECQSRAE